MNGRETTKVEIAQSDRFLSEWTDLVRSPRIVSIAAGFVVVHVAFLINYYVAPDFLGLITAEDGFLENSQAILYLFAAIVFLRLACCGGKLIRRCWLVLFALGFIFIAGEEISWGQRIFGFQVKVVEDINVQGEFNVHNIAGIGLSPSMVLTVMSLAFGVLVPVGLLLWGPLRSYVLDRLAFPAPHPVVGLCFLLSYAWYRMYHPSSPNPVAVEESREATIALGFFVFAWLFRRRILAGKGP